MSHYKYSTKLFENLSEMAREAKEESIALDGGYEILDLALLPIEEIIVPEVWSEKKLAGVLQAIQDGKPLPPIEVVMVRDKYKIGDGIHRTNASIALGLTHVPAIITTWHQVTPREEDVDGILTLATLFANANR